MHTKKMGLSLTERFPLMHEVSSKMSEYRVSIHMRPLTPAFTSWTPERRACWIFTALLEKWEKVPFFLLTEVVCINFHACIFSIAPPSATQAACQFILFIISSRGKIYCTDVALWKLRINLYSNSNFGNLEYPSTVFNVYSYFYPVKHKIGDS